MKWKIEIENESEIVKCAILLEEEANRRVSREGRREEEEEDDDEDEMREWEEIGEIASNIFRLSEQKEKRKKGEKIETVAEREERERQHIRELEENQRVIREKDGVIGEKDKELSQVKTQLEQIKKNYDEVLSFNLHEELQRSKPDPQCITSMRLRICFKCTADITTEERDKLLEDLRKRLNPAYHSGRSSMLSSNQNTFPISQDITLAFAKTDTPTSTPFNSPFVSTSSAFPSPRSRSSQTVNLFLSAQSDYSNSLSVGSHSDTAPLGALLKAFQAVISVFRSSSLLFDETVHVILGRDGRFLGSEIHRVPLADILSSEAEK